MIWRMNKGNLEKGIKHEVTPALPSLSVDEMVELAKNDPTRFQEIASDAGHSNPDTFLKILERAKMERAVRSPKSVVDAYSINRYAVAPNPAYEQYYTDLEIRINKHINKVKNSTPRAREKLVAAVQNAYRQLYEREKHKMIYERVSKGMDLVKAKNEVDTIFKERSERNMSQSDFPHDLREAESKAMLGIYARGVGDVDMANDILGPSLTFGEWGIQNKRGGLSGGRKYWPRGKPDTSIDE